MPDVDYFQVGKRIVYDETLLQAIATAMGRVPCRTGRFSEPGDEEEHRMEQAVAALDAIEAYWLGTLA